VGKKNRGWGLVHEGLPVAGAVPASLAQFVLRLKKALPTLKRILSLREQCGDVFENKGRLLKTRRQSGNIYENKGDVARKRECC
jgi:hypothetical protein